MGIRIKDIGTYHPENRISNEYFLNFYKNKDMDISGFLKSSGREYRYISDDPEENTLTMTIKAAKNVLKKCGLDPKNIDFIVYVSDTPEYLAPTNASKIHRAINADYHAGVLDMNCNCLGMIVAIDQMSKMMANDKNMNNILIVGSQQIQRYAKKSEPITYANFGDSACAVILEKCEDEKSNVIDSLYYTDSSLHGDVHFPCNGISKALLSDDQSDEDSKLVNWFATNNDQAFGPTPKNIETLIERNDLEKKDIKKYFISQMVKSKMDYIREKLGEPEEKFPFIGDRFGYTGVTSPILALESSLAKKELNRGDNIIFWSIGAGATTAALLIKY